MGQLEEKVKGERLISQLVHTKQQVVHNETPMVGDQTGS